MLITVDSKEFQMWTINFWWFIWSSTIEMVHFSRHKKKQFQSSHCVHCNYVVVNIAIVRISMERKIPSKMLPTFTWKESSPKKSPFRSNAEQFKVDFILLQLILNGFVEGKISKMVLMTSSSWAKVFNILLFRHCNSNGNERMSKWWWWFILLRQFMHENNHISHTQSTESNEGGWVFGVYSHLNFRLLFCFVCCS